MLKLKLFSKLSMIATPMTIICGLLVSGATAKAEDDNGPCSNRTLQGDYGFAVEGLVLPVPGVALPIRGVHITHFDGKGNLTQADHIVVNGVPPAQEWTPGAGTYTVNANCTGTMFVKVPINNDFFHLRFVIVRQGKQIHTVVTAPFNGPSRTVTSVGTKIE